MRRLFLGVSALALFGLFLNGHHARGQEKLAVSGWGSLSGKVTLNGPLPAVENLVPKMMIHADKACCLAPNAKPAEKVDLTWVVDPKTKGVANVVVWLKAPPGKFFPINEKLKKRSEVIMFDQPHCAFLPRVAAFQPFYKEDGKEVLTGQKMLVKNSAMCNHNVRAIGLPDQNPGFNVNLPGGAELDITTKVQPQRIPISVQCDVHPWMAAKLFVFDHPYYAITKEDGSFEMPIVPAGAEVNLMAYHEGVGWLLTSKGMKMTLEAGKNAKDFEVTPPPPPK